MNLITLEIIRWCMMVGIIRSIIVMVVFSRDKKWLENIKTMSFPAFTIYMPLIIHALALAILCHHSNGKWAIFAFLAIIGGYFFSEVGPFNIKERYRGMTHSLLSPAIVMATSVVTFVYL